MGREAERHERRECRTDEPRQIGGESRAGVAILRPEVRAHRAGRLAVGKPQQQEADEDENVLPDRAGADQERRENPEHRDHDREGGKRAAAADSVGDVAGGDDAASGEHRTDDLHDQELYDRLARVELDPGHRKHRDQMEQRVAGERGKGTDQ